MATKRGPYTIHDLTRLSGATAHQIHAWVKRGFLPPPLGKKRWATYTEEHLRLARGFIQVTEQQRTAWQQQVAAWQLEDRTMHQTQEDSI